MCITWHHVHLFGTDPTTQTARRVAAAYNNYAFDKKHTLVACLFNEFDKYARVPDEYAPPEPKPFEPMQGLLSWLTDRRGRCVWVARCVIAE